MKRKSKALVPRSNNGELDLERARSILQNCHDIDLCLEIGDAAKLKAEFHRIKKHGLGAENDARRVTVEAHARIGEKILEAKKIGAIARGSAKMSARTDILKLRDLGLDRETSSLCQKLAKLKADKKLDAHMDALAARGEKITLKSTIGATSHAAGYDSDEWWTPEEYVNAAREVMGAIDLDPASNKAAQKTVRAERFYSKRDDGLKQPWAGRVWLNPPYSQPAATKFADRLLEEHRAGNVTQAVMVQNSGTDTAWFHRLASQSWICLVAGRINFVREDGKSASNRYAQCFFYFGDQHERFCEVFQRFGLVGRLTRSEAPGVVVEAGSEWFADAPAAES